MTLHSQAMELVEKAKSSKGGLNLKTEMSALVAGYSRKSFQDDL